MSQIYSLSQLGWKPFYQQQLSLEEWHDCQPARVIEVHRSRVVVVSESACLDIDRLPKMDNLTIGDWLLINGEGQFVRPLERSSLLFRKAPGTSIGRQNIAANVDTLFIVCSVNQDFNLNRIERYLTIAHEAGAQPVVVLSKADECEDSQCFKEQVQSLDPLLTVETVNCLNRDSVEALHHWCTTGKTVALLGSSGVGKSTLVNTLSGSEVQATGDIRHDDDKGKHTTTSRSVHFLEAGGLVIDTPGMRELQLADCETGLDTTFADIVSLSKECKFADCQHQSEPGCAVKIAIENGQLEQRRLDSFHKLQREQGFNSATLAQKRAKDKSLSKMYRRVMNESRKSKTSSH